MTGSERSRLAGAICALAVAVTVTACGSGGDDTGSAADGGGGKSPLKFMFIAPVQSQSAQTRFPMNEQVAKAFVAASNAKGGIGGRKLEMIFCDDKSDPNQTAACARRAVQEHVAAAAGFTYNGDQLIPTLQKAGIPWFTSSGGSASEGKSDNSFPVIASTLAVVGNGLLAAKNCRKPKMLSAEFAQAEFILGITQQGEKAAGGTPMKASDYAKYTSTTTDFAPIVAKAMIGDPDCLVLPVSETAAAAIYGALKSSGKHPRIIGNQGTTISDKLLEQFPDLLDGGLISGNVSDYDGPAWSDMHAAIDKYADKGLNYSGIQPQGTWIALTALTEIARSINGDITGKAMLEQTRKSSAIDLGDKAPAIDFTKEWDNPSFPRFFVRTITFSEVKDGKLVPAYGGKFFDTSPAFADQPIALG